MTEFEDLIPDNPEDNAARVEAMLDRMDPELRHVLKYQPEMLAIARDPKVARRQFVRALKVSAALRGPSGMADRVDVRDGSFTSSNGGHDIGIRTYRPRGVAGALPVLVYLHGAILVGDLDTEHERCLRYAAEAECIVVSVDYRRPPEDPYPASLNDSYAAIQWVHETAHEWEGDPSRIAVGGSSSGAMLAATVALLCRDRGGPQLALHMLLYPALDDEYMTSSVSKYSITGSGKPVDSRWIWQYYIGPDPTLAANPLAIPARCTDFAGVAPAYVLIAEIDPLRDEGLDYARQMMRAGVRVEVHMPAKTCHGFDAANPTSVVSKRSLEEQAAALRKAFATTPSN